MAASSLLARTDLEALLRAKKLDRTLKVPLDLHDESIVAPRAPTGVTALDRVLLGGFPRGHVSEIVGAPSSGRTSLLLHVMATMTKGGELVALVDAVDRFDVPSGAAAGIDLDRLLWIRGRVVESPGPCRDANLQALERSLQALALVLKAGTFGLVVFDVADAPPNALRRLPFTTWLRLQRMVEGSQTACVFVGTEPVSRSAGGLTLHVKSRARTFSGFVIDARVSCAHARHHEPLCVPVSAIYA